MTTIIIIEKSGTIKERTVKSLTGETIYKAAGFKTATDFKCHTVWNLDIANVSYSIELYGKTTGRAGQENKYEFPPPVDSKLFFGGCVIINRCKTTREIVSIRESEWTAIYNTLYGGFEDIEMSEDDEDDEYDSDDELPKTKNGYTKDGFIVDDDADAELEDDAEVDEDEDDDSENDSDDDDDFEDKSEIAHKSAAVKKGGGGRSRVAISKIKKAVAAAIETHTQTAESIYLDCTTELTEEEYEE